MRSFRVPNRKSLIVLLSILSVGLLGVAPKSKAAAKGGPQASCASCQEKRSVLDPKRFSDLRVYEPEARAGYEVARKYPATLDRLHCFCECQESTRFHHKTLLTCFTDDHAAGCGICLKEALMAADLKEKGASDEEIEITVESVFKTDGHRATHGPG